VKGVAISLLRVAFPRKFHGIKTTVATKTEIQSTIHSLQTKNSSGFDGIRSKVIKVFAPLISHPPPNIFTHSLFTGIFPDCHKKATKLVCQTIGQFHY
jgi:hypothetical protein